MSVHLLAHVYKVEAATHVVLHEDTARFFVALVREVRRLLRHIGHFLALSWQHHLKSCFSIVHNVHSFTGFFCGDLPLAHVFLFKQLLFFLHQRCFGTHIAGETFVTEPVSLLETP